MQLRRCFDVDVINRILEQPSVAVFVNDDVSLGNKITDANQHEWIGVYEGNECKGVFLLVPQNGATVEMHTALLIRGSKALDAARLLVERVFSRYHKLVTHVPDNNKAAKLMALKLGFVVEGINRQSFLQDNILHDQTIFGMTKQEWTLCQ